MVLTYIVSVLVCVISIILLRKVAHHIGAVDEPDGRKQHEQATPTVGGLAMFIAVFAALLISDGLNGNVEILMGCAATLLILGIWDDKHNLSVKSRMMMQIILVLVVVVDARGTVRHLGDLFGVDIPLGIFAIPFTVLSFVGGINAFNMIDGADGIAGFMALITTLGVTTIIYVSGNTELMPLAWALTGALGGFLLFNSRFLVKRAWIFMGNAGSLWLGLVLCWFTAQITKDSISAEPALALWLFGIPLIDTLTVMIRRVKSKRSPFRGDRTHIHHVLEYNRLSVKQTMLVLIFAQLVLNGVGVLFYVTHATGFVVFFSFLLLMAVYYYRLRHFSESLVAGSLINSDLPRST